METVKIRPVIGGKAIVSDELNPSYILGPGSYNRSDLSLLLNMSVGEMIENIVVREDRRVLLEIGSACSVKYGTFLDISMQLGLQISSPAGTIFEIRPGDENYLFVKNRVPSEVGIILNILDY